MTDHDVTGSESPLHDGRTMTRSELLHYVTAAIEIPPMRRPVRIAIDGRSAAGKTTLADDLASILELQGHCPVRASLDDFHPAGYKQRAMAGAFTSETYVSDAYDYDAFRRLVLEPFGPAGSRRCLPKLRNSLDDVPFPEEWKHLPETAFLVADGTFLLHPALRPYWDLALWLDMSTGVLAAKSDRHDRRYAESFHAA